MLIPSTKTSADTFEQHKALQTVTEALEAINLRSEAFTQGQYNILRVIAAYPLEAHLGSSSKEVEAALGEDNHALATLSVTALVAALATTTAGASMMRMLKAELKRLRGGSGSGDDSDSNDELEAKTENRSSK